MTAAEQLRSDLLDVLQRLKLAHHALADGRPALAAVQIDGATEQLAEVRARLVQLLATSP